MHTYASIVSVRKLLAVLVALAVLFAPAFSRAGEAVASVPDQQMQMIEGGHCQSPPSHSGQHDEHDKGAEKGSCVSVCVGAAVTPAPHTGGTAPAAAAPEFAVTALHLSYLGEIATPPPKLGRVQDI